MVYVRSSSKGHGLENRIEGVAEPSELEGRRVVLIEDLISTGGSSIKAVNALREAGAELQYCLAIFSYGLEKAETAFAELDPPCSCIPILEYDRMVSVALAEGYIDEEKQAHLLEWRRDPFGWGEARGFPPEKE
jgi:orotate phosphoribosyltransferase